MENNLEIKKLLGQRIKELRTGKGLTQEQLTEKLNIGQRTLSKIERGNAFVSAETLVTNRVGNQIIICNEKRNFVLHENITWHR